MPDILKPDDFQTLTEPLLVRVRIGEAIAAIELTVQSIQLRPPHRFRDAPFSMTLRGPRNPGLPQGTYPVEHPALGLIELFIVPTAGDAQSMQYEVTFN